MAQDGPRLSNTEQTQYFMSQVLSEYANMPPTPARVVVGGYMPQIEAARLATRAAWKADRGVDLPDDIYARSYGLPDDVYLGYSKKLNEVARQNFNPNPVMQSQEPFEPTETLRHQLASARATIFKHQVASKDADMGIETPLAQGPFVRNNFNGHHVNYDCAVATYGMGALWAMGDREDEPDWFQASAASSSIRNHPATNRVNRFDLPWLMGTLNAPAILARSKRSVGVITTIGASLSEIDERIMQPIKRKQPGADFILGVLLESESGPQANHSLSILSAHDGTLEVQDPNWGHLNMLVGEFWERWVPTNMQAVVTVVAAQSK